MNVTREDLETIDMGVTYTAPEPAPVDPVIAAKIRLMARAILKVLGAESMDYETLLDETTQGLPRSPLFDMGLNHALHAGAVVHDVEAGVFRQAP